jgi:hypothetical protein
MKGWMGNVMDTNTNRKPRSRWTFWTGRASRKTAAYVTTNVVANNLPLPRAGVGSLSIREMQAELTAEETVRYYQLIREIKPEIKKLEEVSQWQQNNPKV